MISRVEKVGRRKKKQIDGLNVFVNLEVENSGDNLNSLYWDNLNSL